MFPWFAVSATDVLRHVSNVTRNPHCRLAAFDVRRNDREWDEPVHHGEREFLAVFDVRRDSSVTVKTLKINDKLMLRIRQIPRPLTEFELRAVEFGLWFREPVGFGELEDEVGGETVLDSDSAFGLGGLDLVGREGNPEPPAFRR